MSKVPKDEWLLKTKDEIFDHYRGKAIPLSRGDRDRVFYRVRSPAKKYKHYDIPRKIRVVEFMIKVDVYPGSSPVSDLGSEAYKSIHGHAFTEVDLVTLSGEIHVQWHGYNLADIVFNDDSLLKDIDHMFNSQFKYVVYDEETMAQRLKMRLSLCRTFKNEKISIYKKHTIAKVRMSSSEEYSSEEISDYSEEEGDLWVNVITAEELENRDRRLDENVSSSDDESSSEEDEKESEDEDIEVEDIETDSESEEEGEESDEEEVGKKREREESDEEVKIKEEPPEKKQSIFDLREEEHEELVVDPSTGLRIKNKRNIYTEDLPGKLVGFPYEEDYPSLTLAVGSQRTGKTYGTIDILKRRINNEDFEALYVLCPAGAAKDWGPFRESVKPFPVTICEKNLLTQLQTILDVQAEAHSGGGNKRIGIVLDDIVGLIDFKRAAAAETAKRIASQCRHPNVNCDVFLLVQDVGSIPKIMRNNAEHVFMFGGRKTQCSLLKDMQNSYSEKQLEEMLSIYCTDNNFLYFNKNNTTPYVHKIGTGAW